MFVIDLLLIKNIFWVTGNIKFREEKCYITTPMVMWWGKFQETDEIFLPNIRKIQAIFQKQHMYSKYNAIIIIVIIIVVVVVVVVL